MRRLIIKYDDINDIHSVGEIVKRWEQKRQPVKSLKMEYQDKGMTVVAYEEGYKDAIIMVCRCLEITAGRAGKIEKQDL